MNVNVRNEILDSINNMETVTLESSLDVLYSLAAEYDKSVMIMEHAHVDDLPEFAIFQEAEATATEGEAAPTANAGNAEAKQEPSLGMKILMFIPNIIRKIWQFLKDSWNGVIVPKAEEVSEKAKSVFEKVAGQDESWVKEHATELGLSGAALTSVLAFVAICKKEELKQKLEEWTTVVKVFWKSVKVAPILDFDTDGVKTTLNIDKMPGIFDKIKLVYTSSIELVNNIKDKKIQDPVAQALKIVDSASGIKELKELGPIVNENGEPVVLSYEDFIKNVNEAVAHLDEMEKTQAFGTPFTANNGEGLDEKSADATKKVGSQMGPIARILQACSSLLKWIVDRARNVLGHRTQADKDINNNNTDTENAEQTDMPTTGENVSVESSKPVKGDGKGYTPEQLKEYNPNLLVSKDGKFVLSKKSRKPAGPFQIEGIEGAFKRHGDGLYYLESTEELSEDEVVVESSEVEIDEATEVTQETTENEVNETEEVTQEAAVEEEEELSEADIAINNHWYR